MRNNIEDITKFIFIKDEPEKADIIFIPGSSNWVLAETAARLYKEGKAGKIMPSGMYFYQFGRFMNERVTDERYKGVYRTEAEFLASVLIKNAIFTKELIKEMGIEVKTAILCPQAFHARRAFMTYSHLFPDTKLFVVPTNTQNITSDNWYNTERGRQVVLGELRKCGEYFENYIKDISSSQSE